MVNLTGLGNGLRNPRGKDCADNEDKISPHFFEPHSLVRKCDLFVYRTFGFDAAFVEFRFIAMAMIIMSIQNTFGRKTYNATICSDMCSFRECALAFHVSSSCQLNSDPPPKLTMLQPAGQSDHAGPCVGQ